VAIGTSPSSARTLPEQYLCRRSLCTATCRTLPLSTATLSALSAVGFEASRCVDGRPFAYTADTPFATCRTTSTWGSYRQLDLGNQTDGYCIDYIQVFKSYVYPGESDKLGVLLSNTNGTVL
jgi:hypothetical protein